MTLPGYFFATGRIRVLEKDLLSSATIERMLGASSASEAHRALSETAFAPLLEKFPEPEKIEALVLRHLRDAREDLQKMIGVEGPLEIIWRKYDFHNLRATAKAILLGWSSEELKKELVPLGSRSRKVWLDFFEAEERKRRAEGKRLGLDASWLDAFEEGLALFKKEEDPQALDLLFDRKYLAALRPLTKKLSPFFRRFAALTIDLFNLSLSLRAAPELFEENFAEGGKLPRESFANESALDDALFAAGLSPLRSAIAAARKEGNFAQLGKAGDDLLVDFLLEARKVSAGPEPVFAFWLGKKNDAMIVRAILLGKLAGLPAAEIRRGLRKAF